MTKITIIQLSDIHTHSEKDPAVIRLPLVAQAAKKAIDRTDLLAVMITGDIAFSGAEKEYKAILPALNELKRDLEDYTKHSIEWILTPGNHDGTFKESSRARLNNIDAIIRDGEPAIDDSVIQSCTEPQKHYFDFEAELLGKSSRAFNDPLLAISEFKIQEKIISFWQINASWMSKVPEKQGDLVYPIKNYTKLLQKPADYRIAVLHHPINWYAQHSYHTLRDTLTGKFCIIFSGHEHVNNGHIFQKLGEESRSLFIESGALGPHSETETPSFSITTLSLETGDLEQKVFKFSPNPDGFIEDSNNHKHLKVNLNTSRTFETTLDTREKLEELGAPFAHPARDVLRLSDIYVEPLFSSFSVDDSKPNTTAGEIYERLPALGHILIRGDEHFGKSCFLNRLFLKALAAEVIPISLTAKELSNGNEERRDRIVEERIGEHYGKNCIEHFKKLDYKNTVVLVDDLDSLGTNVESYVRALNYISKKFGNAVLTVSERFEPSLLGSGEVAQLLSKFEELKMLGFSYAMRTDLIQRWYELDTSLDKTQIEQKVHDAQTQIDHAVAKALVPSTAFNTLMILNALQVTEKSQVVDAGVAQHYDMLIRRRLSESGTSLKEFDGIYAYLSHMAWWLRTRETTILDRPEFDAFNTHFTQTIHPINTTEIAQLLTKSRILSVRDGSYQFRHPSARYFFLAHYIADHADEDAQTKNIALNACKKLYRKENANLIVFLASKTASKWIIKEVAAVLTELLNEIKPFNITKDAKTLNGWITETAKLAIEDSNDQKENRRKHRERQEEARALENGHPEAPEVESLSQLDMFTQINLVFKTSEILGLILKSRYGSLDAKTKNEILKQLFDGPLRAISFFLGMINEQPDALLEYLSAHWEDKLPNTTKEQRLKLAKKFVYYALGAYSQALLQRQGEISGSPDLTTYISALLENVNKTEKEGNAPPGQALTYRLLGVASRLSYPGEIPFTEIEKLSKELAGNSFGFTLLQGLVAHHLYMFSVSYSTRQQLAAAVDLDLKKQISNEITSKDTKTLITRHHKSRNPQSLLARLSKSFLARNKDAMDLALKKPDKKSRRNDD